MWASRSSIIAALQARLQAAEDEDRAKNHQFVCRLHPAINWCHHWGCADCVFELRTALQRVTEAARDLIQAPSLLQALGRDHSPGCECALCRVQRALADL